MNVRVVKKECEEERGEVSWTSAETGASGASGRREGTIDVSEERSEE